MTLRDVVTIRAARADECDTIAAMVRRLAADTGQAFVPRATGDDLRAEVSTADGLVTLLVALRSDTLVGALVGSTIFSTWRASRGLYVVDLFVQPDHRGERVGERLVAAAAKAAYDKGGVFIKLEVVAGNDRAKRFYKRLGFRPVTGDENYIVDGAEFTALAINYPAAPG
jgi:ribosomal protein S18 acetylase RimI-like enzyme